MLAKLTHFAILPASGVSHTSTAKRDKLYFYKMCPYWTEFRAASIAPIDSRSDLWHFCTECTSTGRLMTEVRIRNVDDWVVD